MAEKGKGKGTVAIVEEILTPIVEEYGVILWDVQFVKEGASWFLKVIIDKDAGVDFNDCENVSRKLDKKLDEIDPIEQSYFLEVSSPGLERELTRDFHFQKYIGEVITIKSIRPIDGQREFKGELIDKVDSVIRIKDQVTQETVTFQKPELSAVRLFEELKF